MLATKCQLAQVSGRSKEHVAAQTARFWVLPRNRTCQLAYHSLANTTSVSIMMMVDRIGVIRMPWLCVVIAIAPHSCTKYYNSVCMVPEKSSLGGVVSDCGTCLITGRGCKLMCKRQTNCREKYRFIL
jgi:hypothetical protein